MAARGLPCNGGGPVKALTDSPAVPVTLCAIPWTTFTGEEVSIALLKVFASTMVLAKVDIGTRTQYCHSTRIEYVTGVK